MAMLTSAELKEMRNTQIRALPGSCTILRKNLVDDDAGGFVESWENIADGVPCRLSPEGGADESVVASRFQGRVLRRLTLEYDQKIHNEDRVVFGDSVYEVVGVDDGAEWETARRVLLARLTGWD